jgi:flagellar protein FliJ
MTTTDPLSTLLEQAEAERNQALAAFNQARARCDAARAQALQPDNYRADYQQRWGRQFARGAALEIVRCYQGFAGRLDAAISQQAQAVSLAEVAQARAIDALTAHELRVASVRKLIERREFAERQMAERHHQKQADEISMRVALDRNILGIASRGARS